MRLDHLLSKEHLAAGASLVVHWGVYQPNVLMRPSSLVDRRLFGLVKAKSVSTARKGVEPRSKDFTESGTLLGPEGSARQEVVSRTAYSANRQDYGLGRRGTRMRDRSYFENFTVDASIFVVTTSY